MKIAIVGMGVAGLSILRELVGHIDVDTHSIIIFANEASFGTGLPYQQDDQSLILNQYTETMSMIPEDPLHFVRWIKDHTNEKDPVGKYMPRSWYGEYLLDMLKDLLEQSKAAVINEEVTSIRITDERKYCVTASSEGHHMVDVLHLAAGHLAYQDPFNLKGSADYIHHPYPVIEKLKKGTLCSHVGILGTGLTAIDILLYLKKNSSTMKLSMVSLDGKFRSVRGPEKRMTLQYLTEKRILAEREANDGVLSFETVKDWFKLEVEDHGLDLKKLWKHYGLGTADGLRFDLNHLDELGVFQSVIQSMKHLFPLIWVSLSDKGREEYLTKYAEKFIRFRSPIPASSARKILEIMQHGDLSVYKDTAGIKQSEEGFEMTLKSPDQTIQVDHLINATGQSTNLNTSLNLQHALIQQLVSEHIVLPYKYGGVQISYPDMSVINQTQGVLPTFKIYGQLVSGIDYENNTVELISQSAGNGVRSMVKWMNEYT